jgi:hypothetical protein
MPDTFSAGSSITVSSFSNSMCTGPGTNNNVAKSGVCLIEASGSYRFKRTAVSAPTTVSFPVSSPVSAPTTRGELTGYIFLTTYLDSTCASTGYALAYPLNTCLFYITLGQEAYAVLTATSTAYVFERFSDSACTIAVGTAVPTTYTAAECSSANEKLSVQSSISPPISKATATYR